ncbi:MAG: hypothetical protein PHG23_01955, partial [Candidatus Pacebacteria bacterium]|nr:hypothetical protein [Candidatus Paceibacterota bacterium]
ISVFGSESNPGIDKDIKITVLFHSMKDGAKGYVRNIDEYAKSVSPFSNEREMIYLNVENLESQLLKGFLAHEFVHLVTFNQKDAKYNVTEDVWLNEARAEYAPTLLGYNDAGLSSDYLANRLKSFMDNPYESLVDWQNKTSNYGVISLFSHYLVDHYGIAVLADSLKSREVGIESINSALARNGFKDNFNDAYTNFIIASYINDCSVSEKYCFKEKDLQSFHVMPFSNFLPFSGESTLYLGQSLKDYSAHWQKYSGGTGSLKLKFENASSGKFVIPYIIKSVSGGTTVGSLKLNNAGEGELIVPNMGKEVASVTVIPSVQVLNYGDASDFYYYSLTATSFSEGSNADIDNPGTNITLPFEIDKPLNQMNREELLTVLLRLIITLLAQGKQVF